MKVYHERKSYATRTDEPPEKQAPGMGNGDCGLGIGDWGLGNRGIGTGEWRMGNGEWGMGQPESASAGRESIKSIIPIARLEPL